MWLPQTVERKERPDLRKKDGGSWFDDELATEEQKANELAMMTRDLMQHLVQRPDHVVYVGGAEERTKMREVFNHWKREGILNHNPTIKIDYGVAEGNIRVGEDRG